MITLKTLENATTLEVFQQIKNHLLNQNAVCDYNDSCLYKNNKGLKCAAGCLISNEEYEEYKDYLENNSWSSELVDKYPNIFTKKHMDLIEELQFFHDNIDITHWPRNLIQWEIKIKTGLLKYL